MAGACPCGSGAAYADCCRRFHRGEAEPPDAERLMRARFAAFACVEPAFLWRTLDAEHEDRGRPERESVRDLERTCRRLHCRELVVLDREEPDAQGVARVLFVARLSDRQRDASFVELSDFRHDGAGWRYWRGELIPARAVEAPERLTIESFRRLLAGEGG